jgi:ribosomal protein L7/L12|tara:strand:+ start:867 stop:992 length:126 start_codon:yes stop_codon:yes gene_type:complete
LKEAKETVESAPTWIKKELVKDEAEAMKEKLEALGGKIRLA